MKSISKITKENFNSSFNLIDILQDSVYYPASGTDATHIEVFGNKYYSYINVDYSQSYEDVRKSMEFDFEPVGYKLIGIKDISKEELTPKGVTYSKITFNKHEINRLTEHKHINDLYYNVTSSGYAIWAVYELDDNFPGETNRKANRFSILHICGEGWWTFNALYLKNKINPIGISIIQPGEGYGDNWTLFTHPKFRLYQSLRENIHLNGVAMPRYILKSAGSNDGIFWGEYSFSREYNGCSLYEVKENK